MLSMTEVTLNGSGPNTVLTRPWGRYVDAGWAGGVKSSNGGLRISSRTLKRCPLLLDSGYGTAWRKNRGWEVPL